MAEVTIAGNYSERKEDRFIRDCLNPTASPLYREGKTITVLSIGADCPQPDEVTVNGIRYVLESRS